MTKDGMFAEAPTSGLEQLSLTNVTAFEQADFEFCTGVNLIIGANATGKTHVLRAIKAITARGVDEVPSILGAPDFKSVLRWGAPEGQIVGRGNSGHAIVKTNGTNENTGLALDAVYVPAREWLSYAHKIGGLGQLGYDLGQDGATRTHIGQLLIPKQDHDATLLTQIEGILLAHLEGELTQEPDRFVLTVDSNRLPLRLAAEGMRKLWAILHLIRTGHLRSTSVLLWDEPAATLNPILTNVVVQVVQALAEAGVQVVLTTHDYLLAYGLSLYAEFKQGVNGTAAHRYFCLGRNGDLSSPVAVTTASTLPALGENPILREFSAHDARERRYFLGQP